MNKVRKNKSVWGSRITNETSYNFKKYFGIVIVPLATDLDTSVKSVPLKLISALV